MTQQLCRFRTYLLFDLFHFQTTVLRLIFIREVKAELPIKDLKNSGHVGMVYDGVNDFQLFPVPTSVSQWAVPERIPLLRLEDIWFGACLRWRAWDFHRSDVQR